MTYCVGGENSGSSQRPYVASAFNDVDGMNVVCIDNTGSAETSHYLGEYIDRYFAPREIAESRECNSDCRIDVSARYTARNPHPECSTWERIGMVNGALDKIGSEDELTNGPCNVD